MSKKKRIIIAGSRTFNDYDYLVSKMYELFQDIDGSLYNIEIVSGMAKGADTCGIRFAKFHTLNLHKFPANWNKYGKKAGPLRNIEMAKFSDCLVVFWDGKSKGTKHMIDVALKHDLETFVCYYDLLNVKTHMV